jgi:hypothetical protein
MSITILTTDSNDENDKYIFLYSVVLYFSSGAVMTAADTKACILSDG